MNSLVSCTLAFFIAALLSAAGTLPTAFGAVSDQELETIVAQRLKGDRTGANLAVAYIEGDHVARAFVAAGDEAEALRIGPDSAFEIGSVSKTMTAALLADLILRGEASLDGPLSDWLPEGTQVPDFEGQAILLRHIVTHTSGLPALPPRMPLNDLLNPYAELTEDNLLASLADVSLSAPPGTQHAYSNFAAMLLSYALARRADTDFETLLRDRLFIPLGMDGAYVEDRPEGVRAAVGHMPNDGQPTASWVFPKNLAGVGGVHATLDDMVRYVQAQLTEVAGDIGPALRLAHRRLYEGRPSLGMHWMQNQVGELTLIFHGGVTGGFSSFVAFDMDAQRGVVALSDTSWGSIGGLGNLAIHLLAPSVMPLDAPRVQTAPPEELLDALVGHYLLGGVMPMTLTARDGTLHVQTQGQPEHEMGYDSAGDFFALSFDAVLSPNEAGGVHSFAWMQGGGTIPATRVDSGNGSERESVLTEDDLRSYAGKYRLMPRCALTIRVRNGHLEAQATGQDLLPLQPSGEGKFVAPTYGIEIHFHRDDSGEVESLTLSQAGQSITGKRDRGDAAVFEQTVAALSEDALADYVGHYPLIPGLILTIRAKGYHLEAQATGQGAFRLDYSGNDRFSASAFGVEIQFNRDPQGQVESLTLYQGGQLFTGKRE